MTIPLYFPSSEGTGVQTVTEIVAPLPKVTGGVLFAPLGTPLPTDAVTPISSVSAAYKTLGRVSSDGVTKSEERGAVDTYDWGGNLVATLQDKFGISVKFKLLQLMNADVQDAAHGTQNVSVVAPTSTVGTEIKAMINAELLNTGVWILDAYYNLVSMRFVIPIGRPTVVGPITWVNKELTMVDLTIRPFPDNYNNHAYEYWNDGVPL